MDSTTGKRGSRRQVMASAWKWTCGVCTYQNDDGKPKCEMCQTIKGTSSRKNVHLKDKITEQQTELNRIQLQKQREANTSKPSKRTRESPPSSPPPPTITPKKTSSRNSHSRERKERQKEKDRAPDSSAISSNTGGIMQSGSPNPNSLIVRALKRIKAVDVQKSEVTSNGVTVPIWAFKSAAPTFGFNLPE